LKLSIALRWYDAKTERRNAYGKTPARTPEVTLKCNEQTMYLTTDKSRGFRWWSLAALVGVNAVALALVAIGLWQLYERDSHKAEILTQNTALAVDLHLSNQISKIDLSLKTVVTALDRHFMNGRAVIEDPIPELVRHQRALLPETEGWSVMDAEGRIVFLEGNGEIPSFSVADRDYFRDHESGRATGLVVSKALISRLTGDRVVTLSRAIRDRAGQFMGVVVVSLPVKQLSRGLSGFGLGFQGVINLRDADLGLVAGFPERAAKDRASIDDHRLQEGLRTIRKSAQGEGTFHAVAAFDLADRIISFRKLSNAPLFVFVSVSKEALFIEWRNNASRFAAVLFLLLLVCDASVLMFFRQWRRQQEATSGLEESLLQLRERDNALVAAQDAGKLGTYAMDLRSGTWSCSAHLDAIFGIDEAFPRTIEGRRRLIHPDDLVWLGRYFHDDVVRKRCALDCEFRIVRPCDGVSVWVHALGRLDLDADGEPVRMTGTIQDVSKRRAADDRLHLIDEVFLNASEGVVITDDTGGILETNPAFTRITGYSAEEVRGRNLGFLRSEEHDASFDEAQWHALLASGTWDGELTSRRKDGTAYVQYSRMFAIYDANGQIVRFAATISDITDLKESQRRLERLAYSDDLTGLPNRAQLSDRMRQAIAECRRRGDQVLGVCCIDLDRFKEVNERWGHDVGDQLLRNVAQRLQCCVRAEDTVARLGGDEFVVLLTGLPDEGYVREAAGRLLAMSDEAFTLDSIRLQLTFSIGISLFTPSDSDEPDALLRQADQAMYDAKRRGKNRISFFDIESERRLREHHVNYERLVDALAQGEFRLHYQPKVCLRNGTVDGVEALLRWQHPERGLLYPADFLSDIETSELVLPVGEWILHQALEQQQRWHAGGVCLTVSVNVFPRHLQRSDFVDRLQSLLAAHPEVDARWLELEIVETTALENLTEVNDRINRCAELGVRFALDDFGTGYSSLTYLRQLPADTVKIDRSFVAEILDNPEDRALVEGIVGMARLLQRKVVAEGVESTEHGAELIRCGCDFAQGFGIARPMPPERIPDWLAAWSTPPEWRIAAIRWRKT